jgi:acetyltransferase-like isoleucine patch superfamily enzyme
VLLRRVDVHERSTSAYDHSPMQFTRTYQLEIGGRESVLEGVDWIIRDRLTVGACSTVGAGAVVIQDTPPNRSFASSRGCPARVVTGQRRERET